MQNKSLALSEREQAVLLVLCEGKSNKEIAFDLRISENTVENHLKHIYAKLNVRSRTEAALIFLADKK